MHPMETPSIRPQRIGSEIRRVLANCFTRKRPVSLPGLVTINRVQVAPGCQHAKVFVSIYGNVSQRKEALHLLSTHTADLRHELSKNLRVRRIPQLAFVQDDSVCKTEHLCRLLDNLPSEKSPLAHEQKNNMKQQ